MTELKTLGFLGIFLLCGFATPRVIEVEPNTSDLALQVARVAANEGAFRHRVTTALVWQVVRENGGKTNASKLRFLNRHSQRVGGTKRCYSGNCFWTPFLARNSEQPQGLILREDYWQLHVAPVWRDTLAYADWLVRGQRKQDDPCPVKPRTWGGPMDREGALREGLYPIGCRGSQRCTKASCNDGYTTYNGCWKNGQWSCERDLEPEIVCEQPPPVVQALALRVQSGSAPR